MTISAVGLVKIGDSLVDHGSDDALLEPHVGGRCRPDRIEVIGERGERGERRIVLSRGGGIMLGDPPVDLGDTRQRPVPARLQLAGHEAVLWVGGIILAEGSLGVVARRLEIARQRLARIVAPCRYQGLGRLRGVNGSRLNDRKQRCLDHVVDTQAAEGDAGRLAIIQPTAVADVARDVVLRAGVLDGELAAAAAAAQQPRQQRGPVLGRAMAVGGRNVVAHHLPDRLRALPLDVAFMGSGLQCQPLRARLASGSRLGSGTIVLQ